MNIEKEIKLLVRKNDALVANERRLIDENYRLYETLESTRNELSELRMQHISDVGFVDSDGEVQITQPEKLSYGCSLYVRKLQSNTDKPLPLLNQKWSKESEIINQAGFDKLNADKPELTHEKNVQIRKQSFHRFNNSMIGDIDAN
jgi:hypothetical protein